MVHLISDFTLGTDKINLIDVRYVEGGAALFPAFSFIGTGAVSDRAADREQTQRLAAAMLVFRPRAVSYRRKSRSAPFR